MKDLNKVISKLDKIVCIVMIVLMLACICSNAFAVSIENMKSHNTIDSNAANAMETIGGTIVAYITNGAIIISVIMIAVLGIKYMLGSAEEKAEYKKSFVPLLIGAILVFGAAVIAKIIVGLAGTLG